MPEITHSYPLIAAQGGIWMADQLSACHNAFAVAHAVRIEGELAAELLLQAISLALKEADTLHYAFEEREGEVRQRPGVAVPLAPEWLDYRQQSDPEAAAQTTINNDLQGDLRITSQATPYRHLLIQLGDQRWIWYQRYHHLRVDGYSFIAITRRIAEIYNAWLEQQPLPDSPFTPFSEVIDEYLAYQQSKQYQRDAAYWQQKVTTLPQPLSLSPHPLNGQAPTTDLLRHELVISATELAPLYQQLQAAELSPVEGAIALVASWLARLTGQQSLSCGFIFMRRLGSSALTATGPVINLLPMAIDYHPKLSFIELTANLAQEVKRNRRHQRYDAEQIARDCGRLGDQAPLFGPVLNVKLFDYQLNLGNATATTEHLASGPVRDLEIALLPMDNGSLKLEFLANRQRYSDAQLSEHIQRLPRLVRQLSSTALAQIDLLSPEEAEQITQANQTQQPLTAHSLDSLLQQQARRTPESLALSDQQQSLSYQEMQNQVNALAQQLWQRGVRSGDIVAVALPRSRFLSLALQSIVRIGAIWLPLDTGYPDDRLQFMLQDATPKLLITEESLAQRFTAITDLPQFHYQSSLAAQPVLDAPTPQPEQGAYLIYTSGSTGRPKGVLVSHKAIVNRLLWMQDKYPLTAKDVVLQKTPSSFDVSVWEFFWPLISGARLHMAAPDAHRDPEALTQIILTQQVSVCHFVPSMLATFLTSLRSADNSAPNLPLRLVFCSGEALPTALARQWQNETQIALHNLYGPTEAAVDVSWYPAYGADLAAVQGQSVPIGWPVWNTQLHILDNALQPVAPGMAGELWLSGVQLAEGYYHRPELTASRFVAMPDGQGQRMYRSGDIARRLENGAIEYLGRSDDQLKIRGQRIELGEIDAALLDLPKVNQAVTLALTLGQQKDGFEDSRQLISYVTGVNAVECDALLSALQSLLPAHMLPVKIIALDNFPLTSNGKLDRKALPKPSLTQDTAGREPGPGLETQIAEIFCELLSLERVTADADFFALGGHSLLAMRLAARLRRDLQLPIEVGQIMVAGTVEKLARVVSDGSAAHNSGFTPLLPLRAKTGSTLFCFHPASGFAWQFSSLLRYLDPNWALIGVQSPDQHGPLSLSDNLDQVCDKHLQQILSHQPAGPYYFLGYSLGGTLAQGIAARLEARGEKVAFLGLLDTWPPESQNWSQKAGERQVAPEVLAEIDQEREQFVASQRQQAGEEMSALFTQVTENYAHSVRLLSTAQSSVTRGKATLFSAQQTRSTLTPREAWQPYIRDLDIIPVPCAHVEIISAAQFERIGPEINRRLQQLVTD